MADETDETPDEATEPVSVASSTDDGAETDETAGPVADGDDATEADDSGDAGDDATTDDDAVAAEADDATTSTGTSATSIGSKASAVAKATDPKVVARRTVTSKRVTPKGAPQGASTAAKKGAGAKGNPAEAATTPRYTPPSQGAYAKGPSPIWVPILMFGLLIVGALVIMGNYMGVFGTAANIRLVIGLAFILGGIVTATQYR